MQTPLGKSEDGLTMVGRRRLDNVHEILETVVREGIPGDFIEAGSWRGGVPIFVAAFFKVRKLQAILLRQAKSTVAAALMPSPLLFRSAHHPSIWLQTLCSPPELYRPMVNWALVVSFWPIPFVAFLLPT